MKKMSVELNLFDTAPGSTDPYQLATERITTRVYLISLALSISILIFYTSISPRFEIITIRNPLGDDFNKFYEQYRSTLHCPCHQITIAYGLFMSISPVFHPVCTSWLVSEEWFRYLTSAKG